MSFGGGSDELSAKADAEDGFLGFESHPDGIEFRAEEGIGVRLVDANRTAEDDEQVAGLGLGRGKISRRCIDEVNGKTSPFEDRTQGAEIFEGNVLENNGG